MRKQLLSCIAIVAIAITANAQSTFNGAQAGQSYSFITSVSSGTLDAGNPYSWTKNSGDADLTLGATLNQASVLVNVAGGATNGDQAVFQVVANSNSTPGCPSAAQTITVTVGNASFSASIAATQSVCQNDAATIAVTLAESNAAATTISGFTYYIDADNSGTRNGAEALASGTVTSDLLGSITLVTSAAGTQNIIISSITGSNGVISILSAVPNTVKQVVTINALPVLTPIVPN